MKKIKARLYLWLLDFFNPLTNDLKYLFVLILIVIILLCGYFASAQTSQTSQTTQTIYSGSDKIRIDGAHPNHLGKGYVFFHGGAFVKKDWGVCNEWKKIVVVNGDVSFRVNYPTAFLYPTLSALNNGVNGAAKSLTLIQMNCQQYGVHPDSIYLCGTSAGGIVAMQLVFNKGYDVAGVLNGWGAIVDLNDLQNSNTQVYNVSTDIDVTVPLTCAKSFGVNVCGSTAIYNELIRLGVKTDWLVWEGYKHGLLPKDLQYMKRVNHSFNSALKFFK